jgi:hypothetical protein
MITPVPVIPQAGKTFLAELLDLVAHGLKVGRIDTKTCLGVVMRLEEAFESRGISSDDQARCDKAIEGLRQQLMKEETAAVAEDT